MSTRCVAFSVYGDDPKYVRGVEENAALLPDIYPGWGMRVYCDRNVDVGRLVKLGCTFRRMPLSRGQSGMFWRFLPAWDMTLERVIFRDADSRLNVREAAAVQEWIESGMKAHSMHDHPHHTNLPFQGGMWGVRVGCLPQALGTEVWKLGLHFQPRVADMKWLRDRVFPILDGDILHHSSQKVPWTSRPFPEHEPYDGFVGQIQNEHGNPI